jgi:hypothetical protein
MEEKRIAKRVIYMNLETTRLTDRSRNRWQDKVYNREEWKKLLRMARNRRILHMPIE